MERTPVENSTQIASVGYDSSIQALEVEFKTGGIYRYSGVPFEMADAFVKAPSMGRFLGEHINGKFEYQRVA